MSRGARRPPHPRARSKIRGDFREVSMFTAIAVLLALVPAGIGVFGSLAVANYHHRG